VVSADIPLNLPAINNQFDFFDNKIKTTADRETSIGIEFSKYYPNKNLLFSIIPRIISRNSVINSDRNISFGSDQYQVNGLLNYLISNKKQVFEDITKHHIGAGLAFSYLSSVHFESLEASNVIEDSKLINRVRLEGLINIGLLEDVFNIDYSPKRKRRTSLSKFNLLVRFSLFDLGSNFSNKYLDLNPALSEFQKSKDFRTAFEIRYNHLFDLRRNIKSDYSIVYNGKWPELTDPIKKILPPLVNDGVPRSNFSGNFFMTFGTIDIRDTLEFNNTKNTLNISNTNFNNFSFGYTFNMFGNYQKDQGKSVGQEILNKNFWRRNLFFSGGLRNTYISANNADKYFKFYEIELQASAGIKLRRLDKNLELVAGCAYFRPLKTDVYTNFDDYASLVRRNNAYFLGIGKSNYYLVFESRIQDFVLFYWQEFLNNLSIRFSVGF